MCGLDLGESRCDIGAAPGSTGIRGGVPPSQMCRLWERFASSFCLAGSSGNRILHNQYASIMSHTRGCAKRGMPRPDSGTFTASAGTSGAALQREKIESPARTLVLQEGHVMLCAQYWARTRVCVARALARTHAKLSEYASVAFKSRLQRASLRPLPTFELVCAQLRVCSPRPFSMPKRQEGTARTPVVVFC